MVTNEYLKDHVPRDDEHPLRSVSLLHHLLGPEAEREVGDGAEAVGVVGAAVVNDVVRGKVRGCCPSLVVLELVRVRHQVHLCTKFKYTGG